MLRGCILPQSEVIRAILLECSPCCGCPHLEHGRGDVEATDLQVLLDVDRIGAGLPALFKKTRDLT